MATRQYLVTIHESENMTDEAWKIHTILTSRDHILPRERVEVVAVGGGAIACKNTLPGEYTSEPVKVRVFFCQTGNDPYPWSVDAIDGHGGYTEACATFATWQEAMDHVPEFHAQYVRHGGTLPLPTAPVRWSGTVS